MKKSKILNILLTSVMLLSTVLTPQMSHALASMQADDADATSEVESIDADTDEDGNSDEGNDSAEVTNVDGETETGEPEDEAQTEEDDDVVSEEPEAEKANSPPTSKFRSADSGIAPMALIDGNYISGFNFILTNKDGEIINVPNNGASVEIDPTAVDYIQVGYDFTFPADLDINANDTYEITLPDVINISARTSSIQPTNGPLVNYEFTSDGRVIFTFTEDWNNDDRSMHIDMQANIDVQLFEEKREVEVNVPYVDGEGFHAVLVGKRDGVEGADIKTGNTFNAENEETNFRPEYAEWTIRVNDTLESYENASVNDTLSAGHTLAEDSIEIYRIPRNYLTGAVTGDPVLIDPSEYTSSSDASSFAIGIGI